jgi:hypothetical protein
MGAARNRGIGVFVMNIAVAAYLFATGIFGFRGGGEIRDAVTSLFGTGALTDVLIIVLAVLAVVAGVFILLRLFGLVFPMSNLILIILAIAWLVFIIMIDVVHSLKVRPEFVGWLQTFGAHLMVLGGMLLATERLSKR